MKKYLGVKLVEAKPEVKDGNGGYKVVYPDGYVSWSPKEVFEEAYRETGELTFGLALEAMKKGLRVERKGWNGKGMWLRAVIPGGDNKEPDMGYENLPYIEIKTADNKLVPWLASQTDMLAEDWCIIHSFE